MKYQARYYCTLNNTHFILGNFNHRERAMDAIKENKKGWKESYPGVNFQETDLFLVCEKFSNRYEIKEMKI